MQADRLRGWPRKLRVEDAKNATFAALADGILPGGGTALLHIAEEMPPLVAARPGLGPPHTRPLRSVVIKNPENFPRKLGISKYQIRF